MNRRPATLYFLKFMFFLAKPWFPLILKRMGRKKELSGTMKPRLMQEVIKPPRQPSIWLHAVSVGEMEAALPIARRLFETYSPDRILLTTTTKEGYTVAKDKLDGLIHIQYYPFDIPSVINKFLNHHKPSLYICMETELWPILIDGLTKRKIPMILANGRISDRLNSTPALFRSLFKWMFNSYTWIGLQTLEDLRRLKAFAGGIKHAEVVGNTKFDLPDPRENPAEIENLRRELGLKSKTIIVFGSTHPGEEEIIARVFNDLRENNYDIGMILAPRHISRSAEVSKILSASGIRFNVRTETKIGNMNHPDADCLLLDTVGELTKMYALGEMAFVGGSLIKRGGHNLLEPACAGIPVLHGPNMDNFRAITQFLHNADAAIQVENEDDLKNQIIELLSDSSRLLKMKANALNAYQKGRGATDKIINEVREIVK